MSNHIELIGITPMHLFPLCPPNFPYNQICETDKLCIPKQKPPMECLLQVSVNLSLCTCEVICTPVGEKLIIHGVKHIKIMYVADEPEQSVHSAHFAIPFCMFVLLKNIPQRVVDVVTVIEDIKVKQVCDRCFYLSAIIFACPEFGGDDDKCERYFSYEEDNDESFVCEDLNLSPEEFSKDEIDLSDYTSTFIKRRPASASNTNRGRRYNVRRRKVKYNRKI